jgi:transcriptional regulator of acetoin/glycerol metabolism
MCGLRESDPLDLPFRPGFEADTRFTRAARPVLDYLGELLPGCGMAAVLLDAEGRILLRVCDDDGLRRRMDAGCSTPGFVWAEEYAGANAVGIALEERIPVWTSGGDHYLEALRDLACAAVPVINPLTQRVEGVLDLTSRLTSAHALMLPMALQAARTIEQRLAEAGSVTEQLLLERFLTASRRPGRMVMVLGERSELSTKAAARLLSPEDRALISHEAARGAADSRDLLLSDGTPVQTRFDRIELDGRMVGSLVTITPTTATRGARRTRDTTRPTTSDYRGRSSSSASLRQDASTMAHGAFPLLITGEAGVGKAHLAKTIAQQAGRVVVLDARARSVDGDTAVLRELSALVRDRGLSIVLRSLDTMSDEALHEVGALARRAETAGSRVIGTATQRATSTPDAAVPIGVRLHIPPLRERPEDILDLVHELLARRGSVIRVAPPLLQALMRYQWPGNVQELDTVLTALVHTSTGPELTLADLPAHYQRSGRKLRRIEHVERAAIVQALAEADGNKTRAAEILEIGRATLYRKMRVYGLASDTLAM